jgi:fermentation-respiration switch protein FrsA (DUF1100 family)
VSFLLNVALSLAVLYGAAVALMYFAQDRLIYYPGIGRDVVATPDRHGVAYDEVTLRTDDGETLHAWWIPAPQALGAVLVLPGNAGNMSHRLDYALMFRRLQYDTLLVDYRGYGRNTGKPSEEGTYRDAAAAWRWLTQTKGYEPRDIVIYGESLGGAVASWLAAAHTPGALVLASTFTSVPDLGAELYRFVPVRWLSRYRYDTLERMGRVRAPVLVIHSRDDEIVPYAHGRKIHAAANEPKAFLEIAGGHNDSAVFVRHEWVEALAAFLRAHRQLRSPSSENVHREGPVK